MRTETLFEFETTLDLGTPLSVEETLDLIREVWRLKTALIGKNIDLGYWRDSHNQIKADFDNLKEENQRLNQEVSRMMAVAGLPRCDLENRWSNCAVRCLKQMVDNSEDEGSRIKLLSWEPERPTSA
jgi:hypothetical protein